MNYNNFQIKYLFVFLLISMALSLIIMGVSYLIAKQKPEIEKMSPYECGFDPFTDTRSQFQIKFYLVSILFILFDLEMLFFFPFITYINNISFSGYYIFYFFVYLLTCGFLYEWFQKALDWE